MRANPAYSARAAGLICVAVLGLAGCGSLPVPTRPVVYDFGPGAVAPQASNRMAPLPAVALAEVEVAAALDTTALLYRLNYSDNQQLRPYAQARWSMPPGQLVRQRIREQLGQRRPVLNSSDGLLIGRTGMTLRIELEEFSQLFDSADSSSGLVRLRATLGHVRPEGTVGVPGERLVAQRSFVVQRPASSADAAGGVRALTQASDAVIEELDQWIQQVQQAAATAATR